MAACRKQEARCPLPDAEHGRNPIVLELYSYDDTLEAASPLSAPAGVRVYCIKPGRHVTLL